MKLKYKYILGVLFIVMIPLMFMFDFSGRQSIDEFKDDLINKENDFYEGLENLSKIVNEDNTNGCLIEYHVNTSQLNYVDCPYFGFEQGEKDFLISFMNKNDINYIHFFGNNLYGLEFTRMNWSFQTRPDDILLLNCRNCNLEGFKKISAIKGDWILVEVRKD